MNAKETRVCNVCKRELPIARFQRIALWKGGPTVLTACDGCRKPRAKRKQPPTAKTERMINREQAIMTAIALYWRQHGIAPTLREICAMADVSSPSMVAFYLRRLADAGLIAYQPGRPRTIRLL